MIFDDAEIADSAATAVLPGTEQPTAAHPPAWTVVLGAFSFIGLRSVLAHQLVGAFIGSAGVVLIGLAAREVARTVAVRRADTGDAVDQEQGLGQERGAEHIGLVAAGIAAGYAFLFLSDGLIMSETLVGLMVAVTTIAAMRFWRSPTWQRAALFGLAGGVAALTRTELALYLPIVAAVALLTSALPWRTRMLRYATCGVVALAVVAPWVVRNLRAFEEPVLLTSSMGTVLVQTNCDAAYGGEKLGYWELYCGLPQPLGPSGEPLDESQRDVVLRERAFDYAGQHKARLATVVMPARLGRAFALYDPVQTIRFDVLVEGRSFRLSALGLVQYYVLAVAAIGGAFVARRSGRPLTPLLTWIGLVALTTTLTFGNNRYRVSAEPAIVILAAFGFYALATRLLGPRAGTAR